MAQYYDRYEKFRENGEVKPLHGIKLPVAPNDRQATGKCGRTRMDKLSQEDYGNPYDGLLLMLANPQWGGMEVDIPDNTVIRIPFPFTNAVDRYILGVNRHKELYG